MEKIFDIFIKAGWFTSSLIIAGWLFIPILFFAMVYYLVRYIRKSTSE